MIVISVGDPHLRSGVDLCDHSCVPGRSRLCRSMLEPRTIALNGPTWDAMSFQVALIALAPQRQPATVSIAG
jgi:hypothetical protein